MKATKAYVYPLGEKGFQKITNIPKLLTTW